MGTTEEAVVVVEEDGTETLTGMTIGVAAEIAVTDIKMKKLYPTKRIHTRLYFDILIHIKSATWYWQKMQKWFFVYTLLKSVFYVKPGVNSIISPKMKSHSVQIKNFLFAAPMS